MNLLKNWYQNACAEHLLSFDKAQADIVHELDLFIINFTTSQKFWHKLLNKIIKPKFLGIYICGPVGRGKTMLFDALFNLIPTSAKLRVHFHQFMADIHTRLATLHNEDEPLTKIAHELKQQYQIIFLDEMHVSDIATAMILKNLFTALFKRQIYIVTTSNFKPDDLYPDGLMRERFLPAIEVIKANFKVATLIAPTDYRQLTIAKEELFRIGNNVTPPLDLFRYINGNNSYTENGQILIKNRYIPYVYQGKQIIWFEFTTLCGPKRSQLDYLELSQKFSWIIVTNLNSMTLEQADMARRFTLLIDVLYDAKIKLILTSKIALEKLYPHGQFANEFTRTLSRLREMQSSQYISLSIGAIND